LRLHDNVIDVDLQVVLYLPFETELHTPLVCSPCILQSEQHFHIAKTIEGGDEHGDGLVCLSEGCLVITRVGVQETQELTPSSEVNDLVDAGKGKRIFWTCLVQDRVIKRNPPFPILVWYKNWIGI
jgi:hypothetical protein